MIKITHEKWFEEATKRYGTNFKKISFKCPVCGFNATVQDYIDAGASPGQVGFVCIGRFYSAENCKKAFGDKNKNKPGPCDYTGGGLFKLNPVEVIHTDGTISCFFNFSDDPLTGE